MLFPARTDWDSTELLMKAATNAVRLCLTTLCCTAFYTVHRCFGKKRCLYNTSCSYGNQDGCLFVEDPHVCLVQTAVKSTLSACVTVCLCQFTKEGWGECKQNLWSLCRVSWLTHEGGSSDFSCPCTYIIPLNVALWWQRSDPFIKLLNCGAVSNWLSSSRVGRHHGTWWVWQRCCS